MRFINYLQPSSGAAASSAVVVAGDADRLQTPTAAFSNAPPGSTEGDVPIGAAASLAMNINLVPDSDSSLGNMPDVADEEADLMCMTCTTPTCMCAFEDKKRAIFAKIDAIIAQIVPMKGRDDGTATKAQVVAAVGGLATQIYHLAVEYLNTSVKGAAMVSQLGALQAELGVMPVFGNMSERLRGGNGSHSQIMGELARSSDAYRFYLKRKYYGAPFSYRSAAAKPE
ncbi:hypothetical protein B0T26DRAFT_751846 [Lasiosphaeria miniovina]|uniref:Uncharacterized protein n=1 Tax=Lasiosphaeria miniovina TaxID=1954250 RepID=A0AA40AL32_9PEZI|nr:uncharacterized protein B0T26DRAFT_751846 [Lasiosphaeria miniovina]KAK0717833.1 hypothetical protein B0T26DRAFT_751846 [Lasiosphaeria miniovina]